MALPYETATSGRTILEEVQAKNLLPAPKEGNQ